MNAPYSQAGKWTKKADQAAKAGAIVVGLFANRSATAWYRDHLVPSALIVHLHGRLTFDHQGKPVAMSSAPFSSILAIWPRKAGERLMAHCTPIAAVLLTLPESSRQITTGIGSIIRTGATVTRGIFCGITTIRNGPTPLRRLPSPAASSAVIVQVGSSCCKSFTTASGHRRRSTSSTSRRSMSWWKSSPEPCDRHPSVLRCSPCAIVSSVVPSGHGHPSNRAAAVEQRQISLPATVPG